MASKPITIHCTGLEPVLSQTEKSCIASNYSQFSTSIRIKFIQLIQVVLARAYISYIFKALDVVNLVKFIFFSVQVHPYRTF